MLSVCLYFCESPLLDFRMPELISMKLGIYVYIVVPELISTAYLINPSHQCACVHVYPSSRY
jgi:hypothetical protein